MKEVQENMHSFVVRLWLEPREMEGEDPEWRGRIEHVGTGRRRYLGETEEILDFILPYLKKKTDP